MAKSATVIKIFDVEKTDDLKDAKNNKDDPIIIVRGHHDLIHDLNWSPDDNFLVSASADGLAKVWDLTDKDRNDGPKNLNYASQESREKFEHAKLVHPSYVYGAKIFPEPNSQSANDRPLIIASCCFD
jgi:WD40 repeat protein